MIEVPPTDTGILLRMYAIYEQGGHLLTVSSDRAYIQGEAGEADRVVEFDAWVPDPGEASATCTQCGGTGDLISSPSGSWWAHRAHPYDSHDFTPPLPR